MDEIIVKYYGVFDASGKPTAFYTSDMNPTLPAAAVEISKADWEMLCEQQATARYVNGQVTYITVPPPPPVPVFVDANARLDAGITAAYDVAVAVKNAMQATPNTFSNANFTVAMIQLDALTEAFVEMLKAQMPPVPPP